MNKDMKRRAIILSTLVLSGILIMGAYPYIIADRPSANFKWIPEKKAEKLPEVVAGNTRIILFEFVLERDISKVNLEIKDAELRKMGVFISDETVAVKDGKASSQVFFNLKEGTPPRRYDLEIIAKDAATGKVIGKGIIPFAVYPYFYNILKCSC
ncbi:MAG: hypothetical protein AB1632_06525 [Nitrospirota bacterium]